MNAANSEINKLAYMSPVTVTISLGGSSWTGGGGFIWDGGLVEGEKDGPEEGCRLLARIGFEL